MSLPKAKMDSYSDIQVHFTAKDWAKISNYERICIKNIKENYEMMREMSGEFWLISAPGEKTCQQTWERLNGATVRFICPNYSSDTRPEGRTLTRWLGSGRYHSQASHYLGMLEDQKDRLAENLMANKVSIIIIWLYSVTLFKKVVDEYKLLARENKFMVREFTYNEEELNAGKNELNKLAADKKRQYGPLVRWLKINFSEAFQAWVHVKALRVFVESVLRYGLPVNFQPMILQPYKKTQKKMREVLNTLYGHLDGSNITAKDAKVAVDMPGLMFANTEYYPYVFYPIQINFCD
nr:V-type proton ATPase subunit C 1-like [Lytechinus pictus]